MESDELLDLILGRRVIKLLALLDAEVLKIPLSLSLASSYESAHQDTVDLSPILAGASRDMGDDVSILALVESWLMTDRAFSDLDYMFLAAIVTAVRFVEGIALFICRCLQRGDV
ncbi:hypothetical protein HG531_008042 [Fusarium graminearum]|nr:hypothetical protein HG531_008042 [Fusarium graminearum]